MMEACHFELATNEQLWTIINSDKHCPSRLMGGVVTELINRKQFDGIIKYAAARVFRNVKYVCKHILKMDYTELIHIGYIEIFKHQDKFKPGMRTFKTYALMCLIAKFSKMRRDYQLDIRRANSKTKDVDLLPEKIQEALFKSPVNIERYVINKLTVESMLEQLNPRERLVIYLDSIGISQYEISERIGSKSKTYANVILRRAYDKMRKMEGIA